MDEHWLGHAYPGQYRPYYKDDLSVGYLGAYHPQESDSLKERVKAVLRAYLASYHVGQYIAVTWLAPHRSYSGYNDYSDVDLTRLKTALLDIKKTADAHHAAMYVFVVPRPTDFERRPPRKQPVRAGIGSSGTRGGDTAERSASGDGCSDSRQL